MGVKIDPKVLYLVGTAVALYIVFRIVSSLFSRKQRKPGAKSTTVAKDAQSASDKRPRLTILFGSQTGTAEMFSATLAKEAERWGFRPLVQDLQVYDRDKLSSESCVMFAVASYGEGEPTDSAREFFEWLMNEAHSNSMSGVKFTVFGLGNRQYKYYQKAARDIDRRMEELGGQRIFEKGEGNADVNIEEDFEDWKARVFPVLSQTFNTQSPDASADTIVQTKTIKFLATENKEVGDPFPKPNWNNPCNKNNPYRSKIVVSEDLLSPSVSRDDDGTLRTVRHIEFDTKGADIPYQAGDHLGVYPSNGKAAVEALVHRLNVPVTDLDRPCALVPLENENETRAFFPMYKTTIRMILSYYVDFHAPPKKNVLRVLAQYAEQHAEKAKLELMALNNEEGRQAYKAFIMDAHRSLLDVLVAFPSCKPPLAHLLEVLPRMQPRYYSIASSPLVSPDAIHACVAVVRYAVADTGRVREGICSSFLASLAVGECAYIFVRKSTFHLPHNPKVPVVMIGPGTGIAPFMGFVQQRQAIIRKEQKSLGDAVLYFGCRKEQDDFLYRKELGEALAQGALSAIVTAFSRDGGKKVYVQHRMQERAQDIWTALQNGGAVYVCGDARYMAKDVDKMLAEIVQKGKGCSSEEAQKYITELEQTQRYLRDVWSP